MGNYRAGENEIDDDRDRDYGTEKKPAPEPKYGIPVGYFVKYEGRWQIAFWGVMPDDRLVQVFNSKQEEWRIASLAIEATGAIRFKGNNAVPVYGFDMKRIIN